MLILTVCILALVIIYTVLIGNFTSMLEVEDDKEIVMEKVFHSTSLLPY